MQLWGKRRRVRLSMCRMESHLAKLIVRAFLQGGGTPADTPGSNLLVFEGSDFYRTDSRAGEGHIKGIGME